MGVVGIAQAFLGLSVLFARVGVGWALALLLLALPSLWCAFARGGRAAAVPFLVGAALVVLGALAEETGGPRWLPVGACLLGLVSLVVGTLDTLPGWRHGHHTPVGRRPHA
jgi:hypothetical protein